MDRYIIFVYETGLVCIIYGNPVYLMPNGIANGTNMLVAFKFAAPLTRIPRARTQRIMPLIVLAHFAYNLTRKIQPKYPASLLLCWLFFEVLHQFETNILTDTCAFIFITTLSRRFGQNAFLKIWFPNYSIYLEENMRMLIRNSLPW